MALPNSRNKTYTPADDVRSADLNDLQDMVIGGKHGAIELWLAPGDGHSDGANAIYDEIDDEWQSSSSGTYVITLPLPLRVGDRLKQLELRVLEDNAETITARLVEKNPIDGSNINLETEVSGTSGAAAAIDFTATASIPLVVPQDRLYRLRVDMPNTSGIGDAKVFGVFMEVERS